MGTVDPPPKGAGSRFGDRAPVWIGAIAALITALAGAGFFAFHSTTPSSATPPATPQPVASSARSTPLPSLASSSALPDSATPDGTQLASYRLTLVSKFSVPLGVTPPAQADFGPEGGGDISEGNASNIYPTGSNKMLALPANTTPTYQGCKAAMMFVGSTEMVKGAAFCLTENGRMVGVVMMSVAFTHGSADLAVTVWQDS
jgi:hypothetical protein